MGIRKNQTVFDKITQQPAVVLSVTRKKVDGCWAELFKLDVAVSPNYDQWRHAGEISTNKKLILCKRA